MGVAEKRNRALHKYIHSFSVEQTLHNVLTKQVPTRDLFTALGLQGGLVCQGLVMCTSLFPFPLVVVVMMYWVVCC